MSHPVPADDISGTDTPRIPPGGLRELGPVNWAIARLGARAIRAPRFSLFTVLGQHRLLFLSWLPLAGMLLGPGRLSRRDAELVILRVAHLRDSTYELQQHRRLARSRGVDAAQQERIFTGPDAEGLILRDRVLITAVDEFVVTRSMSSQTWAALSRYLDRRQLIELCALAAHYDGLAAIAATLRVPLDFPD